MKSHTKILLFIILDVLMVKDLSYAKIKSVNPLHLIINQINENIEKSKAMEINI